MSNIIIYLTSIFGQQSIGCSLTEPDWHVSVVFVSECVCGVFSLNLLFFMVVYAIYMGMVSIRFFSVTIIFVWSYGNHLCSAKSFYQLFLVNMVLIIDLQYGKTECLSWDILLTHSVETKCLSLDILLRHDVSVETFCSVSAETFCWDIMSQMRFSAETLFWDIMPPLRHLENVLSKMIRFRFCFPQWLIVLQINSEVWVSIIQVPMELLFVSQFLWVFCDYCVLFLYTVTNYN